MSDNIHNLICVDFDGTICDFAYPGIGAPKAGVKEALTRFRELGYRIMIYSCRTCNWYSDIFNPGGHPCRLRPVVLDMRQYLSDHGIPYDEIDYGENGKPMACLYIDDKGIRFENNWPQLVEFVEKNLKP